MLMESFGIDPLGKKIFIHSGCWLFLMNKSANLLINTWHKRSLAHGVEVGLPTYLLGQYCKAVLLYHTVLLPSYPVMYHHSRTHILPTSPFLPACTMPRPSCQRWGMVSIMLPT
jgi:hypothetical protein